MVEENPKVRLMKNLLTPWELRRKSEGLINEKPPKLDEKTRRKTERFLDSSQFLLLRSLLCCLEPSAHDLLDLHDLHNHHGVRDLHDLISFCLWAPDPWPPDSASASLGLQAKADTPKCVGPVRRCNFFQIANSPRLSCFRSSQASWINPVRIRPCCVQQAVFSLH